MVHSPYSYFVTFALFVQMQKRPYLRSKALKASSAQLQK